MSSLEWFRRNADRFQAGSLRWDEPLARHTYYRIGGPADLLVIPAGREELQALQQGVLATKARATIVGAGSNLLASDEGYRGIVVKTTRFDDTVVFDEEEIRTGGSVTVTSLLRHAGNHGWEGFELLAGVPGAVGGIVAMNAGTHLGEAKDLLTRVEIFTLLDPAQSRTIAVGPDDFAYRENHFLKPLEIVASATWRLVQGDPAKVKEKIADVLARRKASQPLNYPSCGSVFRNPRESGKRAWEVIETLGLRGHRIGNAQFSEKHPNFIVNLGDARASDVRGLIELAKREARAKLGIALHEEVKYLE